MITVGILAKWIVDNRRGKAFSGYDYEKIIMQLSECSELGTIMSIVDNNGNPCGVCCCTKDEKDKVMYVNDILTTEPGAIKRMLTYFINHYPGWTLQGLKKTGKLREFRDSKQLLNRLNYGK